MSYKYVISISTFWNVHISFMYKFLHTFSHKTHADVHIVSIYKYYNFHLEISINLYVS